MLPIQPLLSVIASTNKHYATRLRDETESFLLLHFGVGARFVFRFDAEIIVYLYALDQTHTKKSNKFI